MAQIAQFPGLGMYDKGGKFEVKQEFIDAARAKAISEGKKYYGDATNFEIFRDSVLNLPDAAINFVARGAEGTGELVAGIASLAMKGGQLATTTDPDKLTQIMSEPSFTKYMGAYKGKLGKPDLFTSDISGIEENVDRMGEIGYIASPVPVVPAAKGIPFLLKASKAAKEGTENIAKDVVKSFTQGDSGFRASAGGVRTVDDLIKSNQVKKASEITDDPLALMSIKRDRRDSIRDAKSKKSTIDSDGLPKIEPQEGFSNPIKPYKEYLGHFKNVENTIKNLPSGTVLKGKNELLQLSKDVTRIFQRNKTVESRDKALKLLQEQSGMQPSSFRQALNKLYGDARGAFAGVDADSAAIRFLPEDVAQELANFNLYKMGGRTFETEKMYNDIIKIFKNPQQRSTLNLVDEDIFKKYGLDVNASPATVLALRLKQIKPFIKDEKVLENLNKYLKTSPTEINNSRLSSYFKENKIKFNKAGTREAAIENLEIFKGALDDLNIAKRDSVGFGNTTTKYINMYRDAYGGDNLLTYNEISKNLPAIQRGEGYMKVINKLDNKSRTSFDNFMNKAGDYIQEGETTYINSRIKGMMARMIQEAKKAGIKDADIVKELDNINVEEYVEVLRYNKILKDRVELGKSQGFTLEDFNLSHIEDVARNWQGTMKENNLFFTSGTLNKGLQKTLNNKIEKVLDNLNNVKTAKEKDMLIKELKNIEDELIENNLISKVNDTFYGKKDVTAKSSFEEQLSNIETPIKREISEKMFGDPTYFKKDGGIVGFSHLIRPL
tara:strand:+ start:41 stop:2377 length:2337 start_codon:yes stop_codon:yes gene_type:complete